MLTRWPASPPRLRPPAATGTTFRARSPQVFVLDHGRPRARHALHRAVRVVARADRHEARHGAEGHQRGRRRRQPRRCAHDQRQTSGTPTPTMIERDDEVDDLRVERGEARHRRALRPQDTGKRKRPDAPGVGPSSRYIPGSDLLSHAPTHAVPSAVAGLTSVFGMGTGVTLLLWPPGNLVSGVPALRSAMRGATQLVRAP